MISRNLEDGHVGKHVILFAGHQTSFFIEDSAHVLIGRKQTFHQNTAFAFADKGNGLYTSLGFISLLHEFEFVGIDTFFSADLLNGVDITNESGINNAFVDGSTYCTDGMGVVGIGSNKSFLFLGLYEFQEIV